MTNNLDKIDKKILRELQLNARISHQELAERVGLSSTPCARRVKNLEQRGIIKGYAAIVDEAQMGYGFSVFVSVQLDHQTDDRLLKFEAEIAEFPEVMDCWLMTGNRDYLLRLAIADLTEFERFLTGRLTKVEGVASLESSIPIRRVKEQRARF
jgi:Lrp/AsnC family leucine-responsive transcriptional regulator